MLSREATDSEGLSPAAVTNARASGAHNSLAHADSSFQRTVAGASPACHPQVPTSSRNSAYEAQYASLAEMERDSIRQDDNDDESTSSSSATYNQTIADRFVRPIDTLPQVPSVKLSAKTPPEVPPVRIPDKTPPQEHEAPVRMSWAELGGAIDYRRPSSAQPPVGDAQAIHIHDAARLLLGSPRMSTPGQPQLGSPRSSSAFPPVGSPRSSSGYPPLESPRSSKSRKSSSAAHQSTTRTPSSSVFSPRGGPI